MDNRFYAQAQQASGEYESFWTGRRFQLGAETTASNAGLLFARQQKAAPHRHLGDEHGPGEVILDRLLPRETTKGDDSVGHYQCQHRLED